MLMLSLYPLVVAITSWTLHLATWLLARSLNMPQPVVRATGVFMFAQAQAIENWVGKAFCPMRLLRRLRSLLQS